MPLGMLFAGGQTKWPEALGAALIIEGDAYVVRTLIVNSAENKNNAVPFIPFLVPGPRDCSGSGERLPR